MSAQGQRTNQRKSQRKQNNGIYLGTKLAAEKQMRPVWLQDASLILASSCSLVRLEREIGISKAVLAHKNIKKRPPVNEGNLRARSCGLAMVLRQDAR